MLRVRQENSIIKSNMRCYSGNEMKKMKINLNPLDLVPKPPIINFLIQ